MNSLSGLHRPLWMDRVPTSAPRPSFAGVDEFVASAPDAGMAQQQMLRAAALQRGVSEEHPSQKAQRLKRTENARDREGGQFDEKLARAGEIQLDMLAEIAKYTKNPKLKAYVELIRCAAGQGENVDKAKLAAKIKQYQSDPTIAAAIKRTKPLAMEKAFGGKEGLAGAVEGQKKRLRETLSEGKRANESDAQFEQRKARELMRLDAVDPRAAGGASAGAVEDKARQGINDAKQFLDGAKVGGEQVKQGIELMEQVKKANPGANEATLLKKFQELDARTGGRCSKFGEALVKAKEHGKLDSVLGGLSVVKLAMSGELGDGLGALGSLEDVWKVAQKEGLLARSAPLLVKGLSKMAGAAGGGLQFFKEMGELGKLLDRERYAQGALQAVSAGVTVVGAGLSLVEGAAGLPLALVGLFVGAHLSFQGDLADLSTLNQEGVLNARGREQLKSMHKGLEAANLPL